MQIAPHPCGMQVDPTPVLQYAAYRPHLDTCKIHCLQLTRDGADEPLFFDLEHLALDIVISLEIPCNVGH